MHVNNPLFAAWEAIADALPWTHFVTISPHNPYLGEQSVYPCGCAFAKRIRDREGVTPSGLLLVPEQCAEGYWHYHGLIVHPLGTVASNFERDASVYLNRQMQLQAGALVRGATTIPQIRPSVEIRVREGTGEAAVRYAMKNWISQSKAEHVIWL